MAKNWWKQMTDRIRGKSSDSDVLKPVDDLPLDAANNLPADLKDQPDDAESGPGGPIGRWMLRRQISTQVENYIEQFTQTSEKLTAALEKISQASLAHDRQLDQLSRNQDKFVTVLDRHGNILETMLQEIQRLTAAADRLAIAIEAVPKSSREQAEKLSAIEDQLQSDGQTDRALLTSIDSLGRHVASMARYAETQQAIREDFVKGLNQQIQPLIEFGVQQSKFAKANLVMTAVMALTILGFLGVFLVKVF